MKTSRGRIYFAGYHESMEIKQELEAAVRELELARTGLKGASNVNSVKRAQMESKMHWLESKVEKLRKKSQS